MKTIKYSLILVIIILFTTNCGDKFLNRQDLYDFVDQNFYKTPDQISSALTAAYSELPGIGGSSDFTLMSNILSDDCFDGGSANGDLYVHDLNQFTNHPNNYADIWSEYYKGINRSNAIIKNFSRATYTNVADQNQALGEAYFLRSYFYFCLARLFGNVPLITTPDAVNLPKASADALFGQIASDMSTAISDMKPLPITSLSDSSLGHATKWAAEGMMARIFLFYTGYYNKTLVSLPNGGTITKAQVISWVDDCVANSGHSLIPDFRNQWPYADKALASLYAYNKKNNLSWVGDLGMTDSTKESMFVIKYSVWSRP